MTINSSLSQPPAHGAAPAHPSVGTHAAEAGKYLAAAVEELQLRPDSYMSCGYWIDPRRSEAGPARQVLALYGVGQAILALNETLRSSATTAQPAPEPRRRWFWGRRKADDALRARIGGAR